MPLYDDRELLQKIAKGDQHAFRLVYDRFRKKVYTFALRILKDPTLAEEVMQETFLRLWQLRDSLDAITHLESYLRTTARNRSLNVLRSQAVVYSGSVQGQQEWQEWHNETEDLILLNDSRKILNEGIDLLPKQQKAVYQLCRIEGLKYEQAAARLGLSPLTVKKHMQLALSFLRSYMGRHTDITIILIILKLL